MSNIVPLANKIILKAFRYLLITKPQLFHNKDLAKLETELKLLQGKDFADKIGDWFKQYEIADELTQALRIDTDQIPTAPPSPVASNEILDNIFMLVNQQIDKENPPESPVDQPENQQ